MHRAGLKSAIQNVSNRFYFSLSSLSGYSALVNVKDHFDVVCVYEYVRSRAGTLTHTHTFMVKINRSCWRLLARLPAQHTLWPGLAFLNSSLCFSDHSL